MQNHDRPNQYLAARVAEARAMAAHGAREAAAEYLLNETCPLPVIARVLANGPIRKIQSTEANPVPG